MKVKGIIKKLEYTERTPHRPGEGFYISLEILGVCKPEAFLKMKEAFYKGIKVKTGLFEEDGSEKVTLEF